MRVLIFRLQVATHPEMLAAILSVEALEDNEVLIIEGVRHVSRINDPRHKAIFEGISTPNVVSEIPISLIRAISCVICVGSEVNNRTAF